MFIKSQENTHQLKDLYNAIENDMSDWQIISVRRAVRDHDVLVKLANHVIGLNQIAMGMAMVASDYKLILFMRKASGNGQAATNSDLEKSLKEYNVQVTSQKITPERLAFFKDIYFSDAPVAENKAFIARKQRAENKVLIVDDDLFVAKVVKAGFSDVSDVTDTQDSQIALDLYKKINPDMVVLDIHMPDTNGFELCENILKYDQDAYILQTSSDASLDNVLNAVYSGAAGFLAKPIRKDKLLTHARRCVTFNVADDLDLA